MGDRTGGIGVGGSQMLITVRRVGDGEGGIVRCLLRIELGCALVVIRERVVLLILMLEIGVGDRLPRIDLGRVLILESSWIRW
jgi:hypothetical protein